MKKKTLLSLALLSALAVGCQQDEFVNLNNSEVANVNLGNRPELGPVTLNSGDVATRFALNTINNYSWKFEEGDKLGAAIVDFVSETKELAGKDYSSEGGEKYSSLKFTYADYVNGVAKPFTTSAGKEVEVTAEEAGVDIEDFYTIQSQIASNYPYTREGSTWTTQANLVEGNYVFYAPYDKSHLLRQPIVVTLPMEQDCSTTSKALTDFYGGTDPVALGVSFLKAPADKSEVISPSVKMADIFAYPQISIKNNFNGYLFNGDAAVSGEYFSSATAATYTMKLDKIEIYTTGTASLDYKRALDANVFKTQMAGDWDKTKKDDGVTGIFTTGVTSTILAASGSYNAPTYPEYPADKAEAVKGGYATEYHINADATKGITESDVISDWNAKYITCNLGGKELKNGEEYKFFAVMPAEDYGQTLFAKVYVTIGEKSYIILTKSGELDVKSSGTKNGYAYLTDVKTALGDYNFRDKDHGDMGVRLVRGQRYPSAEVLEDASAVKTFAGTLMTINLTGGKTQAAFAIAAEAPTNDNGIKTNEELLNYAKMSVQRGVALVENADMRNKEQATWTAGSIAFAEKNTVVINAELIKGLYNTLYDNASGTAIGDVLTLTASKLPIASDVVVKLVSKDTGIETYSFTTMDGVSYKITYDNALIGNAGNALINGINKVTANATLTAADGTTGAVVLVSNSATATLNKTDGIAAINVESGAKLIVNCSTGALITSEGEITMEAAGSALTNENNVLKGTVTNNYRVSIAGETKDATVSAALQSWPASLAGNTRINKLIINPTESKQLEVEQAQVDVLAELSGVAIELGANVSRIKSTADVTLTNIASIKSNSTDEIEWIGGDVPVNIFYNGEEASFFSGIVAGNGATFKKAE